LIEEIEKGGVDDITILVATGMHRPSTPEEKVEMYGADVVEKYRVIDHDSTDRSGLIELPSKTSKGTTVFVNRLYHDADLKVVTGLIEPHFMAGYSGGRKSICPGIVNIETIQKFHGPGFLEDPNAINCNLEGNPCHIESSEVAGIVGADFMLNTALDQNREIVDVVGGDLYKAHAKGIRMVNTYARVKVEEPVDIVLTSGGGYPLDKTFYQTVKGMVAAIPVVKPGGKIVIVSECSEGVGSQEYLDIMLEYHGKHEEFMGDIKASPVVKLDQWEFEEQIKVLDVVGVEGLILLSSELERDILEKLSVTPYFRYSSSDNIQTALQELVDALISEYGNPKLAVIPDGPYVIPYL